MRVRGLITVCRAVQTDPTLLRYALEITEQKKCWQFLAQMFDRFQSLRNNSQQHATSCNRVCKRTQHVTSNNVASICKGLNLSSAPILLVLFNLEEREGGGGRQSFFIFITLSVLNLFNFLCRCNRLTVFSLFDLIQSCEPRLI